jgi:uncharacterized membrane protein YtjA (UPF0391 family)
VPILAAKFLSVPKKRNLKKVKACRLRRNELGSQKVITMKRSFIRGVYSMMNLIITLLIIALVAAILGFGGIAGAAVGIVKIIFFVALVLFIVSVLTHGLRGGFGPRV